ncbi:MAG: hypothetical protein AB7R40_25245 [Nitrospiraceae bacterium]
MPLNPYVKLLEHLVTLAARVQRLQARIEHATQRLDDATMRYQQLLGREEAWRLWAVKPTAAPDSIRLRLGP